ncbi:cobyrinic acid a,c-diamide synthase [Pandoraea cepalis]|uniref:Cobyrinic acid a,c-diamide synthase n=2 Tax=Burkholderiaceae TaxID=119060 RepID=A0A5E4RDU6_9BURK|nr:MULTISPECIES: ParA family protein [Burkholderiaceae]VVD61460.1 cobyrinic acid a,c-diamide synthase [Pandoraea cepalis]
MMFSCSVWSPKGGVGKSTLSINLAARLALETSRPRVLLVDLDAQQSGRTWAAQAKQCGHTVPFDVAASDAQASAYDIVIFDHAPGMLDASALKSQVTLMPLLPSFFDAAAAIKGQADQVAKGRRVMLLPNRLEMNFASDIAFLAGFVGKPYIRKRKAYQATIARGLTIYADKSGIRGLHEARREMDNTIDALIDLAAA